MCVCVCVCVYVCVCVCVHMPNVYIHVCFLCLLHECTLSYTCAYICMYVGVGFYCITWFVSVYAYMRMCSYVCIVSLPAPLPPAILFGQKNGRGKWGWVRD